MAGSNVDKTQSGISSSQWYSAESLSSSSGDDSKLLGMSSAARGRPPLPPPHGSLLDNNNKRNESLGTSQILTEPKPQPAARSLFQSQSPVMERAFLETHKPLNQEVTRLSPPQPYPRRRLASFGGVSSPGSLSPFTGLGAYNQNNNGNKPTGTGPEVQLGSSLGSRGSTGCLRVSPQSSGRTTPVPMHLQHVRDQMVVALQRLKELEEQVKIIPILQVKISVLQEEKRQLSCQLKDLIERENVSDITWNSPYTIEGSEIEINRNTKKDLEVKSSCTDLKEVGRLTKDMQELERSIKVEQLGTLHEKCNPLHDKTFKSVAVGTDNDMDIILSKPPKENKYAYTEQVEMRSIATEVSEVSLGIYTEQEAERDAQELINSALKERICHLEIELKESALETELIRLKLELQAAGARNRVDKACCARPSTVSIGSDARPHTKSQGVGNHTELRDASTGEEKEVKTVGVSCAPMMRSIYTGLDVPMSLWEVRERVETSDKAVEMHVFTNTQGVGTEIRVCDAESNTEAPLANLRSKKEYCSVACGDCSVDVTICEAKEAVSQCMTTDRVRGVELGIMVSPQTASQRTNTVCSSVSRFTNTKHAFSTDSSTNTLLSTQDKHTNTTHTSTRTVSVGNRVRDVRCTTETRTIGVGTANAVESISKQTPEAVTRVTRDTGVGFTDINENFLVGLKTRNMASGPSHLPDPVKTKSVGVGEGRIRDFSVSSRTPGQNFQKPAQLQWDHELNHYIEKLQRLLSMEHGDLLTEDCPDHNSGQGDPSSCNRKPMAQGGTDIHMFSSQPAGNTANQKH